MHILQINTEKGWRGGERQTLLSMEGLRRAGVTVTLLCLDGHPLCKRAADAGFAVAAVRNQLEALLHIIFRGNRYTVIHAQSSRGFGFAAFASLSISTPLIYTRRVDFVPRGRLTRWKYERAAALVAISKAIKNILADAGMGDAEVISSIVPAHTPDRERCRILSNELQTHGRPVVGVVAALAGHKDPFTMMRAAKRVAEAVPEVLFLHFGDGVLRQKVEAEHARLSLEKNYLLLGYRDGVEDYFPLFRCFAMSSREEGLGSSVLDAFMHNIPVASTSAGGLAELVEERGLLSQPKDAEALARNIITLLRDRTLAANLSGEAKKYVVEHHDRDRLTARYIALYGKVSGGATP